MATRISTGFAAAIVGASSFEQIFQHGVIDVYSGVQPAHADDPPTGTLLARVTRDGGAFVHGAPENGLEFDRNESWLSGKLGHMWRLTGVASGTAGWFRLKANAPDDDAHSYTAPRLDGAMGVLDSPGDVQFYMVSTEIDVDASISIDHFFFALGA